MRTVFCDPRLLCPLFKRKKKGSLLFLLVSSDQNYFLPMFIVKAASKCLKESYDLEKNRLFSLKMKGIKLN